MTDTVDFLLAQIALKIQLSPAKWNTARERYQVIAQYLEADGHARRMAPFPEGADPGGGVIYPEEGVNFSLIMTIADPRGFAPIYEEVRAEIIRRGLRLADITVAPRVRARGGSARSESPEMKGTDHG